MPAFHQEDLDRIRGRAIDYLENGLRYSSDEELAKTVLYETIFAGTPYGHIPVGRVQSLRGITLDDVRRFYHEHYTRDNVVLGLGGGYTPDLLQQVRRSTWLRCRRARPSGRRVPGRSRSTACM